MFFAFLHCWLNAFAEMMRFADRMFYKVRSRSSLSRLYKASKTLLFLTERKAETRGGGGGVFSCFLLKQNPVDFFSCLTLLGLKLVVVF